MGLRFRKSFKVAPGIRMTFGVSGASFNVGPRGSSVSIGKRGVYANASAFGFSSRSKLMGGAAPSNRSPGPTNSSLPQKVALDATIGVNDDGELYFKDAAGNLLPESWVKAAKKQHADVIRKLIQSKCDWINEQIEAIGELHHDTPAPHSRPVFAIREFPIPEPSRPAERKVDIFARIFPARRRRIEADNAELRRQHDAALEEWKLDRSTHHTSEAARRKLIEEQIYTDVEAMEAFLEEALQDISWPRETLISAEVRDSGRVVYLDVDLPEIEDMPTTTAAIPSRGLKLSIKQMPPTKLKQLYMTHVHAIGFRLIGEAFAALPVAQQVVASAYSQRRDKVTGQMKDEYLYSARVERSAWSAIDFSSDGLKGLDVVEALTRFELRRVMSKTGVFKPITPLSD